MRGPTNDAAVTMSHLNDEETGKDLHVMSKNYYSVLQYYKHITVIKLMIVTHPLVGPIVDLMLTVTSLQQLKKLPWPL